MQKGNSTMSKTSGWLGLEDQGRDFPFYNASPVGLTAGQWLVLMCAVAAGLAALSGVALLLQGDLVAFIPAILFVFIPLGTLYVLSGTSFKLYFIK